MHKGGKQETKILSTPFISASKIIVETYLISCEDVTTGLIDRNT